VAYMITAECVNCSACEQECPVQAISAHADQYVIDPNVCIDCEGYFEEARCKWACPVNACVPERETYLERAATMVVKGAKPVIFKDGDAIGGKVLSE
jgi:ferredoxin